MTKDRSTESGDPLERRLRSLAQRAGFSLHRVRVEDLASVIPWMASVAEERKVSAAELAYVYVRRILEDPASRCDPEIRQVLLGCLGLDAGQSVSSNLTFRQEDVAQRLSVSGHTVQRRLAEGYTVLADLLRDPPDPEILDRALRDIMVVEDPDAAPLRLLIRSYDQTLHFEERGFVAGIRQRLVIESRQADLGTLKLSNRYELLDGTTAYAPIVRVEGAEIGEEVVQENGALLSELILPRSLDYGDQCTLLVERQADPDKPARHSFIFSSAVPVVEVTVRLRFSGVLPVRVWRFGEIERAIAPPPFEPNLELKPDRLGTVEWRTTLRNPVFCLGVVWRLPGELT